MSVLLIEPNKGCKYEFTKDELQKLLDKVDKEAFERGVSCGQRMQELKKEKEYIYLNGPVNPCVNWDKVTCKSICTNEDLGAHYECS
jgi:hypothetical protein